MQLKPLSVLIVPDKFKGTLTAVEAAAAIEEGWRCVRTRDRLELLPMSDGGDGFGELLQHYLEAQERTVLTVDAAHQPITARWWWQPKTRTAIIESAEVIGLAGLPPGKFHPFELDTFGLGAVLRAAARARPRHCLVGIGGSATNDGGFGLARALGWRFLDGSGGAIQTWMDLPALRRVAPPARPLRLDGLQIAVDVSNRLLGARGATRIFGPQKGIRPEDVQLAERCLGSLARVVRARGPRRRNPAALAGAGAAGGLGFGFNAFLGAPLVSGFELFCRQTHLRERVRRADLVITGEGAIDFSTLALGKGVGGVARLCREAQVPCLALAGLVLDPGLARKAFTEVFSISPDLTDPVAAKARAGSWLQVLATLAAATSATLARAGGGVEAGRARLF